MPELIHCNRKGQRMTLDIENSCLNAAKELVPKPRFTILIPVVGLIYIIISLLGKNDSFDPDFFLARCFTCSKVRPEFGFNRYRSLRTRSSSFFHPGIVEGISSLAILSQRSSTS